MSAISEDLYNFIRIHPKAGRKTKSGAESFIFNDQVFKGVTPDVFIDLDREDYSGTPYLIIRKLNVTIQVSPHYSTEELLHDFCEGPIRRTDKCTYHGDVRTGVGASRALLDLIVLKSFTVSGKTFDYHSIGVAMNPDYGPVSTRKGNDFENYSSHFEIKFLERRKEWISQTSIQPELVCLNVHLLAVEGSRFFRDEVHTRLGVALLLFYRELGLTAKKGSEETLLKEAMTVDLGNYQKKGFGIKHEGSLIAEEKYLTAVHYDSRRCQARKTVGDLAIVKIPVEEKAVVTRHSSAWSVAMPLAEKLKTEAGVCKAGAKRIGLDIADKDAFPPLGGR
jgi:hypothetical protein